MSINILLLTTNSEIRDTLTDNFGKLGHLTLWAEFAATAAHKAIKSGQFKYALLDINFRAHEVETFDAAMREAPINIIYLMDSKVVRTIGLFNQFPQIQRMVSTESPTFAEEVTTTIHKLESQDYFGVNKYVPGHAPRVVFSIASTDEMNQVESEILAQLESWNVSRDVHDRVQTVYSELAMNALFDAPVDWDTGSFRNAKKIRGENIQLKEGETIRVEMVFALQSVLLSVQDPYGSLKRNSLIESLYRASRRGEKQLKLDLGGTGVGLFMTLDYVNSLVFNVDPEKRTEVIAFFHSARKRLSLEESARSLSFFIKGA